MDKLPPEYFGCFALDDPTCPEMSYLAAEEQADRFYLSLACN